MNTLSITVTKISPTHHTFEYRRADGTGESLELETKTFLFHDFLHFAVETEASLKNSFYGLLFAKESYALLSAPMPENNFSNSEVAMTERVVGALTGVIKANATPEQFLAGMKNLLDAYGELMPEWLTKDFVLRVQAHMRNILGEWNATAFGKALQLRFEMP